MDAIPTIKQTDELVRPQDESDSFGSPAQGTGEFVITIKRSTLYYIVFAFILFVVAYVSGWFMGTSSAGGNTAVIRTSIQEAVATSLAGLVSNPSANTVAQPLTQDPNQRFKVEEDGNPAIGPTSAPVSIVEFSDFQCPFCGRFFQDTESVLLKKYGEKVRFVYRDFPLDSIHPYARGAAEAADCANVQGKFWEYHDLLFSNQQQLDKDSLIGYAKQLKLDVPAFQDCVATRKYASEVESDFQQGLQLGINGTPTFFVNGLMLVGAQPLSAFTTIIDSELAHASTSLAVTPTAKS